MLMILKRKRMSWPNIDYDKGKRELVMASQIFMTYELL